MMLESKKAIKTSNIILLVGLFIIILTGFRFVWLNVHKPINQPLPVNGQLDLSRWTFTDNSLSLNGEWRFYPHVFIETDGTTTDHQIKNIQVPGDWSEVLNGVYPESKAYGFGSYELIVTLPKNRPEVYGIRIKSIHTGARIIVNGKIVKTVNHPARSFENAPTFRGPFYTLFTIPEGTDKLHLVIEASNYDTPYMGGINKSFVFGTEEAITKEVNMQETLQMTVIIVLLLHAVYAFLLLATGRKFKQTELALFGWMLVFMAIGSAMDDETFIQLPIDNEYSFRIMTFFYVCLLLLMMRFIHRLYPTNEWFVKIVSVIVSVMGVLTLGIIPFEYLSILLGLYYVLYFSAISYMIYTTIQHIKQGKTDGYFILFFVISYTSNIVWGFLLLSDIVDFPFYPFDFIFSIVSIALLLFRRHHQLLVVSEKQREKLIEEDQKKDQFLANTSHEIRNPLHAMINIAQLLLNNHERLDEEAKHNLALIIRVGHQLTFTLNDILDITKLKERELSLNKTIVDIKQLTDEVIEIVTFMAHKPEVTIDSHLSSKTPLVYADRHRILRVLFNLLHNALKFTDAGTVVVEANVEKHYLRLSITDSGIGMTDVEMVKIFLPYEKLESRDQDSGGIGLGLNISKQLIEQHGGELSVTSKKGIGSTFHLTLPLATKEQLANEATYNNQEIIPPLIINKVKTPLHKRANEKQSKILIVDDDAINLNVLQSILEPIYYVKTTLKPENVLDMINEEVFDLIISDVMMPRLSGYQLTEEIRKRYSISELPVLLLTARSQKEDVYTGFLAGANDYIVKPVDSLELQARVQALTQLKQAVNQQLQFEAAWLHAQIKPHFIYNTLNAIASLSTSNIDQMTDLLHAFGKYLTNSFDMSNTKPLIPLDDEIELVEAYLYINKLRFKERLQYDIKIEDREAIKVPPLIVQTLVENALKHGILKKAKGGNVEVVGKRLESYYLLQVIDNGVGITPLKLQEILNNEIDERHVGLANTNHRLRKLFNQQLEISSKEGVGTIVTIHLPLRD